MKKNSKNIFVLFFSLLLVQAWASYPKNWWGPIDESVRESWEILPQDVSFPKVILSKRTELGVFSNFANTPFILNNEKYESVEGLWQMLKYPETADDPRWEYKEWPFTREEVKKMSGFAAKNAGDRANEIMKKLGITWVSYQGRRFDYKDHGVGSFFHYQLIKSAIVSKVEQNPELKVLLLKTKGLTLLADHKTKPQDPPAYKYFDILMELRETWSE